MKKKLMLGSLAILMAFSLSACNKIPGGTTPTDSTSIVEGSITMEGFTPEIDLAKKKIKFELANNITKFDLTKLKMAGFTTTITDKDGKEVKGEVELKVGTNAFTASFKSGNIEFSFEVVVTRLDKDAPTPDAKLTGIEVAPSFPTKFYVGEEFVRGDIYLCYNDGTKKLKEVTKENISEFSTAEAGERTLKIEFDGHTITVKYTVVAKEESETKYIKSIMASVEAYSRSVRNDPAQFEEVFKKSRKYALNNIPDEEVNNFKEITTMASVRAGQLTAIDDLLLNQVYDVFKNIAKSAIDDYTPLTYVGQIDDAQLTNIKDALRIAVNLFDDEQIGALVPNDFLNALFINVIPQDVFRFFNPFTNEWVEISFDEWGQPELENNGHTSGDLLTITTEEKLHMFSVAKRLLNTILKASNEDLLKVRDAALVLIPLLDGSVSPDPDYGGGIPSTVPTETKIPTMAPTTELKSMTEEELELSNKLIPGVKAAARIIRLLSSDNVLVNDVIDIIKPILGKVVFDSIDDSVVFDLMISLIRQGIPYIDRILAEVENFSTHEVKAVYNIVEMASNPEFNPETDLAKCIREAKLVTDKLLPIIKDIRNDEELLSTLEHFSGEAVPGGFKALMDPVIKVLEMPKTEITDEVAMKLVNDIDALLNGNDSLYFTGSIRVININDKDALEKYLADLEFENFSTGEAVKVTKEMILNYNELIESISKEGTYNIVIKYNDRIFNRAFVVVDNSTVDLVIDYDDINRFANELAYYDIATNTFKFSGFKDKEFGIRYKLYYPNLHYASSQYEYYLPELIRSENENPNGLNLGMYKVTTKEGTALYYRATYILYDSSNPTYEFRYNNNNNIIKDNTILIEENSYTHIGVIKNHGEDYEEFPLNCDTSTVGETKTTIVVDGKEITFKVIVLSYKDATRFSEIIRTTYEIYYQAGEPVNQDYLMVEYKDVVGHIYNNSLTALLIILGRENNVIPPKANIKVEEYDYDNYKGRITIEIIYEDGKVETFHTDFSFKY